MKASDIKEMTTEELNDGLAEARATLSSLRMTHTVSPLENPGQIPVAKKTVAQFLTEIRNREIQATKK